MFNSVNRSVLNLGHSDNVKFLFYFFNLNYVQCKFSNYCLVKLKWISSRDTCAICHPKLLFRKKTLYEQKHMQRMLESGLNCIRPPRAAITILGYGEIDSQITVMYEYTMDTKHRIKVT